MPLFNGGPPPTATEPVDSVYMYKNGGVGALGQMGVREAAVRAERWAWIVITRSKNELRTYVNGRPCAKIDVSVQQPGKGKGADEGGKKKAPRPDGEEEAPHGKSGEAMGTASKEKRLPERLCIDPTHLALFPPAANGSGAEADGSDGGERGLALRYVKVSTVAWTPEEVR